MTPSEGEEALTELKALQLRMHTGLEELNSIMTILKGEMDLAMTRAQKRLSEFYAKFPEFRNG